MNSSATIDTDLSALAFWARPYEEREQTIRWLREDYPVPWHRPPEPLAPGLEKTPKSTGRSSAWRSPTRKPSAAVVRRTIT